MGKRGTKKVITDYWYDHYMEDHCTLCGNFGVIDTSNAKTPSGVLVGRKNWCICPNGQIMRYHNKLTLPV